MNFFGWVKRSLAFFALGGTSFVSTFESNFDCKPNSGIVGKFWIFFLHLCLSLSSFSLTRFVHFMTKIPLFVVGEPGSSKSLSLTLLQRAMQRGSAVRESSRFLSNYPVLVLSIVQCSRALTAGALEAEFERAILYSSNSPKDEIIGNFSITEKETRLLFSDCHHYSGVILEEVGMAFDPQSVTQLKVLHHLLDSNNNELDDGKKVAFIAISNQYLDAAKMNRGSLVRCEALEIEHAVNATIVSVGTGCPDLRAELETVRTAIVDLYHEIDKLRRMKLREVSKEAGESWTDTLQTMGKVAAASMYGLRDLYSMLSELQSFHITSVPELVEAVGVVFGRNFGSSSKTNSLLSILLLYFKKFVFLSP